MLALLPSAFLMGWMAFTAADRVLGISAWVGKLTIILLKANQGYQPGEGPESSKFPGGLTITDDDPGLGGHIFDIEGLERFRGKHYKITEREAALVAALIEVTQTDPARSHMLEFFLENFPMDRG